MRSKGMAQNVGAGFAFPAYAAKKIVNVAVKFASVKGNVAAFGENKILWGTERFLRLKTSIFV